MTTIKNMETNTEDMEEIYLQRERYLLSVDDLLEQILSEQILENDIDLKDQESINLKRLSDKCDMQLTDDACIEVDIPITIASEFGNI